MKLLIYFICFFLSALIQTLVNEADVFYPLAAQLGNGDINKIAILSGLFAGIVAVIIHGSALFVAHRLSRWHDTRAFQKDALRAGMPPFFYAKSITAPDIIAYCNAHLDEPFYVVTGYLDKLADEKKIKRPCAEALIAGYLDLMNNRHKTAPTASTHNSAVPAQSPSSSGEEPTRLHDGIYGSDVLLVKEENPETLGVFKE